MPETCAGPLVCTIGHSTRALDEFIKLLRVNGVTRILDMRTAGRNLAHIARYRLLHEKKRPGASQGVFKQSRFTARA